MKAELQQRLFDKYPSLFIQKDWPMSSTCMCWGIDCGDGWYDILNTLCQKILEVDKDKQVQFTQVKEKFGSLNVYTGGIPPEISDQVFSLIDDCEAQSIHICEICGQPGKRRSGGWIMTLCDKCNKERP